jgi:hypothetical protein
MFIKIQKTSLLAVLVLSASFACAQTASTTTPATTPTSNVVTFTVTVGDLKCTNGNGVAQVHFANDPEAGGYYEVFGEMIIKNGIALGRYVDLPSGEYSWKGDLNDGYVASGAISGSFTVPKCTSLNTGAATTTTQTLSGALEKISAPKIKNTVAPAIEAVKNAISDLGTTATTTNATSAPSTEKSGFGTPEMWAAIAIALGVVYVFWGKKKAK